MRVLMSLDMDQVELDADLKGLAEKVQAAVAVAFPLFPFNDVEVTVEECE